MENNQMTIDQVLEVTIDILEEIDIPMKKIDEIGTPIKKALGNLRLCIQAIKESRQKEEEQQKEPDVSIEPCDDPDSEIYEEVEIKPAN